MPHSLQQNRPRTVALNLVSAGTESRKKKCETQAGSHVQEQQTAKQLRDLRNLQQKIDDLLVLSNAQHCLQASGEIDNAQRQVFEMEMEKLMTDVGQMAKVDSPKPAMAITDTSHGKNPRTQTSRVQLRLSKPLVKILTAFGKAQRRPSVVVEKTMWKDAQIRDAAEILGVATPVSSRAKKSQRFER